MADVKPRESIYSRQGLEMPTVLNQVDAVLVLYRLMCDYERATTLAHDMVKILRNEDETIDFEDKTCGFDPDGQSCISVTFSSLDDANRLNSRVRELLSRKINAA